jgi:hypothetical protein
MVMPNFLIIGPARCATDALYSYLKQHPQVYMSPIKETNFFVFYGKSIEYCGPGDQEALQDCYVPNLAAYQAQFSGATDAAAIGEASPWYIYCPEVPGRIQHHLPDVKMIAMIRNPVDRAYSSFGMLQRDNREPVADFSSAFALESERIAAKWEPIWHYRSMGMYYEQIKRYYDTFNHNQLKIYIYDEFDRNPAPIIRDMFSFLGVDADFQPDMTERPNQSYIPKSKQVQSLLSGSSRLKSALKPLLPESVRRHLKTPFVTANLGKPGLAPDVRRRLAGVFREDILKLQDLIERDLSAWLVVE